MRYVVTDERTDKQAYRANIHICLPYFCFSVALALSLISAPPLRF